VAEDHVVCVRAGPANSLTKVTQSPRPLGVAHEIVGAAKRPTWLNALVVIFFPQARRKEGDLCTTGGIAMRAIRRGSLSYSEGRAPLPSGLSGLEESRTHAAGFVGARR